MSVYSIKDLERYSGVKAHTLRIWEQRYNLLVPDRTDTNIRTYTNADLRHILNVSFLNNQGLKISSIAKLSPEQIHAQVTEIAESTIVPAIQVDSFVSAMIAYDEDKFEKTFSLCCKKIGFDKTMTEVVYPFLQKLGIMWQTGIATPGQEHFIINLIRQKLIVAIDKTGITVNKKARKFILYLPENEFHEVALLYYNYLLRSKGYFTVYLGQSVPYEDLEKAYRQIHPDYLLAVITCPKQQMDTQEHLNKLSKDFKNSIVFLSGCAETLSPLRIPKNILLFKNPAHFTSLLSEK
ncbi:MAG: MerR family transcriptional regulator [Bacteroidota bacterium]